MSAAVRAEMKDAYPELEEHAARITKILDEEEKRFTRTVEVGLKKLGRRLTDLRKTSAQIEKREATGSSRSNASFKRGFDCTSRRSEGVSSFTTPTVFRAISSKTSRVMLDSKSTGTGFDRAMQEQRTRAKASWKGAHKEAANPAYREARGNFQDRA